MTDLAAPAALAEPPAAPAPVDHPPVDRRGMALYGVPLKSVIDTVSSANASFPAGDLSSVDKVQSVAVGSTIDTVSELQLLSIRAADGRTVYLRDVADISLGAREDQARAWRFSHEAAAVRMAPAVSLAIAKRDGANAVVVSQAIEQRLHQLEGKLIPEGVSANISRNYGETANEKANEGARRNSLSQNVYSRVYNT